MRMREKGITQAMTTFNDTVAAAQANPDLEQPYASLGLKDDEYARIKEILGRRPTDAELAMYSVMWSEHCSYKSSKVHLRYFGETMTEEMSEKILIPSKHGEGRFQAAPETVRELEAEGRVVFRYTDNYNGSVNAIAGITNKTGRVVGLMPHPEHAVELLTGPSLDGLQLFLSAVGSIAA